MIDSAAAANGVAALRDFLQADGADIELAGIEGGTMRFTLLLADARCAECVVPRPMLEAVALQLLQPLVPGLAAVAIHDPREGDAASHA
jgi:hypothetical protein